MQSSYFNLLNYDCIFFKRELEFYKDLVIEALCPVNTFKRRNMLQMAYWPINSILVSIPAKRKKRFCSPAYTG